ncbi:TetR family transcriptional regulator [Microbacterium sp. SLBN-154]|uniref:SACE_7040 family transcriptional regulator n=1 Tax=Microbacterium sp. SLBN-154 TaxID=2768458 RepID=UPI00114D7EA5|nr:TetR/AcrR family transcriptional regulator [Microbacterium sp. SLBN-154]TQK19453.1 TetR family transcriptional regulator [Microbacterium sp. SLBN-154]
MASTTGRDRAKADRHSALLAEAARLFAERGFTGVSLEDLGAAVGVSGPAIYRHFANKQALLGAILVGVSERLRDGGRAVLERTDDADARLTQLVAFHVDFALTDADVIRVQDRDLANLGDEDRRTVRRLQREYVEMWVGVLAAVHPDRSEQDLRVRAYACFGLINSTPHSIRTGQGAPDEAHVRGILTDMAGAALAV